MKLASFKVAGKPSYGIVTDAGIVDLGKRFGSRYADLKALITANAFAEAAAVKGEPADYTLDKIEWLPVVPNPDKIFCIGLNYRAHVEETGNAQSTKFPVIFLRVAASQMGHNAPMILPPESVQLDFEGEIAVIIGKGGRRISEADALNHIAGYAPYNDGSIRDWQRHTPQWAPGKNFVGTGGFGPWMVTNEELKPGTQLTLVTRLNGQEMQRATTDLLIFSIPQQIAYISTFTELAPGDVIVTGTPGGVGMARDPQVWMKDGDVVEVEVSQIGTLVHKVKAEAR